MMRMSLVACALLLPSLSPVAFAQTGAPLLLTPWPRAADGQTEAGYELRTTSLHQGRADLDDTGETLRLDEFESRGRAKLTTASGPGPSVGYHVLYYDLNTDSPVLPQRLVDVSIAGAMGIPLDDSAWDAGLVLGVGYAGTRPFADGDAVYFMGDLIFKRDLDDKSSLTLALNYDGNRSFLPDVPLPGGYYSRRVSDAFAFTVGLPYSSFRWSPDDRWTVSAQGSAFALPFVADVTVQYAVSDMLSLYGSFKSHRPAFWLEDADNRRIFLRQRRLEAGLRYAAREGVTFILAGGWMFDQKFETGWDVRDTDKLRELDDEPFVRFAVDLTF